MSFDHTVFTEALAGLNPGQRQAVLTIDGPVMVIAGPGTGKTQILTLRIANILKETDTKPEQILALTFTESGVRAMRERLRRFIGSEAYHVPIHTFHSFAGDLIKRYPDAYATIVGGRPASELEKIRIIESILEDTSFTRVRPSGDPQYYVKPILQAIATLKKEYVSADTFASSIAKQAAALAELPRLHEKGAHKGKVRGEYIEAEKSLEKNQELLAVYRQYSAIMQESKWYDFEDMILDTIAALESNEEMRLDVQEQFHYILADEHQDVNQSQNRLIEIIASYHEHPNVFVVGDEKQAIYRFQGASLDNFLYFSDVYPGAVTIALTENYRSDQSILDVAHECIKTDDPTLAPLRVPLTAAKTFAPELSLAAFSHTALEEAYVVAEIEKALAAGMPLAEVAVIVRTNREVELFTTLLRKAGIAVAPSADTDILTHPLMGQVLRLLSFVAKPEDEKVAAELLLAPYSGVALASAVALLRARSYEEPLSVLLQKPERMTELGVHDVEAVEKLTALAKKASELAVTKSPAEVVEFVLRTSGFLDFVMTHEPLMGEAVVRRIYDEIEGMCVRREVSSLAEVVQQFAVLQSYGLPLTAPVLTTSEQAVQVMTAHKAKGLEFEMVVLPHLTDSVWGGSRARSDLFELPIRKHDVIDEKALREDDERRLLYVAITRAKRRLLCTYAGTNVEGREFTPSRFLADIAEGLTEVSVDEFEKSFAPLNAITPAPVSVLDVRILQETLRTRGWSATSFNNYVQSPWEYIYKNVLRIPSVKSPELQFGTAVHYVLERAVRHYGVAGSMPSDTELAGWLTITLEKNVLSVGEYTRLHERGMKAVFGYLATLETALTTVAKSRTEYSLTGVLSTGLPDFPEVQLTGNFDRIDYGSDGVVVRVVDYKTGKPKTRGEIAGTTKNSDGNYKRQLVFYALLLSLQEDAELKTGNMLLSFVEPDGKGVIHEEAFTITEEEVSELTAEILVATKAVVTGECLLVPCDPEVTDFCALCVGWQ